MYFNISGFFIDRATAILSDDELKWGEGCQNYLSNFKTDEEIKRENPNIPLPERINASDEEREFAENAVRDYNKKAQYGDPSTYVKKYRGVSSARYRSLKRNSLPENVPEEVREVYNQAIDAERDISNIVDKITEETGGFLFGKDFRIKEGDSFWRKIQKSHKNINSDRKNSDLEEISLEEVAKESTDTVRYTNISRPDDLVANFKKMKKALEQSDCKLVKLHNLFLIPKIGMKCLECIFQHPSGQKFEMWFHTPESKHVQDNGGHKIYEAFRVMDDKEDQKKCEQVVIERNYKIKFPKNIEKIQSFDSVKENYFLTFSRLHGKI